MSTLYTQQSSNVLKTYALMTTFLVFAIAIAYGASWYLGNPTILYIGVALSFFTSIGSYWFSDKIVLRMTNAKQISKEQAPELYNIVENLSITAGLPMPKVFIVEDPSPNAFATGRDPEHAVVAATTGLLQILDRTELEGVMAHELSHVGNRDMLVMTVAVVLAGFIAIVADFFTRMMMFGGGDNRDRHPAFLILGVIGIILAPIAAKMIQLAISRKREYLADASGALLTRYPEGLASALEKINNSHTPMRNASHATAHLFISDPFKDEKKGIMQKISGLFQTHPPAQDRINRLRNMGSE
ncbi:M48 family metalloprotease [Candidatus Kaiserbacteria bacterium]|nr:M48 family metalloprotease [Candidatus Kaiserbacteria bacterium]